MTNHSGFYDLEERSFKFADDCKKLVKKLSHTVSNDEYAKQLVRSSGSVAANYIEANESISKKDFYHRIKISRKEAKESRLWLRLITVSQEEEVQRNQLVQEAMELTRIFASIAIGNKGK